MLIGIIKVALAIGLGLFAGSLIMLFISSFKKEEEESAPLYNDTGKLEEVVAPVSEEKEADNQTLQKELEDSLVSVLSENKGLKDDLNRYKLAIDGLNKRQEDILKEDDSLKKTTEQLVKGINEQKDYFQSLLNKQNSQLEATAKELQEMKAGVTTYSQDVDGNRKSLNHALNQNKIFNYKLKEDLRAISSESGEFKDRLHKQQLAMNKLKEGQEKILRGEIERLLKEFGEQKDYLRAIFEERYTQLDAFKKWAFKNKLDLSFENVKFKSDIEQLTKEIDKQRSELRAALDEKFSQLEIFVDELQKVKMQFVAFVNYSRDRKDWANDIGQAERELAEIKGGFSEQDKIISDTKKGIGKVRRNVALYQEKKKTK